MLTIDDAQNAVTQIEELRAVWQRRLADAQSTAQQIEANAGEQVLAGAGPEMVAMDLAGSRSAIDVAGRALAAIDARLSDAQRAVSAAQAAALRRQIEDRRAELATHEARISALKSQIEEVDGCAWQRTPRPAINPLLIIGPVEPWRPSRAYLLSSEIDGLAHSAAALEAQAGQL